MREIKFRAWDEEQKKMFYGDDIEENYDELSAYLSYGKLFVTWFPKNDDDPYSLAIEQYTGLHDKNGQEIYEGDIVRRPVADSRVGVIQFAQGTFGINWDYADNADPEWREGTMYGSWGSKNNLRDINDGYLSEYFEVIGNIHENPELLK